MKLEVASESCSGLVGRVSVSPHVLDDEEWGQESLGHGGSL